MIPRPSTQHISEAAPGAFARAFIGQFALERTRLLYHGSLLPSVFMLLNGLVCAWILWSPGHHLLVGAWLAWLSILTGLRVSQVAAFDAAPDLAQADDKWLRMFLLGSAASGLTLGGAAIALVPVDSFVQQAWVFGLLGAATLSASVAYAVSLSAFLSFALPCLVPPVAYLFCLSDDDQRGWAWLGLILLGSLLVVAWQVHRLIAGSLLRRFENQELITHLEQSRSGSDRLNAKLSLEIDQRRAVEEALREFQATLEERVIRRSKELDSANRALGESEARDAIGIKALEEQQRLAATVFEAASEGIVVLDAEYRLLTINQAFTRVTGFTLDDVIGRNIVELPSSHDARRHFSAIAQALAQHGIWQGELVETRKDGQLYPQWLQLSVVRDRRGDITNIVGYFTDLSARRESEERMRYLSHFDELTGLANRTLFRERLREAHQKVRRGGRNMALLHIDLDRFKQINSSLGHEGADKLLREIARRISSALPEAVSIARLSGDEFAVLFDAYANLSSLARVTNRLLGKIRAAHVVNGQEVVVSASVGISLLPDSAREIPDLLSQANMAMRHAKHLGGNSFEFYTQSLQASTTERLQLENELRKAIDDDQLEVFYQPKLNLMLGKLDAAEALVRWRHPDRGMVGPGAFIEMAEETGLISQIGEQVLRQACWQASDWIRQGLPAIRVSVNLSVYQLRQGKLVSLVRQVLADTGLPPHLLELELTETQLLDSVEHIIAIFRQLQELGIKMTIDDFGTGYSSLSYLKRFPVDYVKIDQAFIRGVGEGEQDAAIVDAIICMAHQLKLQVVAEGVETAAQLNFLEDHGCDEVQGFLISEPLSASDFAELLVRNGEEDYVAAWH